MEIYGHFQGIYVWLSKFMKTYEMYWNISILGTLSRTFERYTYTFSHILSTSWGLVLRHSTTTSYLIQTWLRLAEYIYRIKVVVGRTVLTMNNKKNRVSSEWIETLVDETHAASNNKSKIAGSEWRLGVWNARALNDPKVR